MGEQTTRVCIVGASGKLGQNLVQHSLDRGYEVVGVCREQSVPKLDAFNERMTIVPGATDDPEAIKRAVAGCDGVLVVLVPRGVHGYSTGTAQAVLDHAPPEARLVFSCGWHITRDGKDVYSWKLKALVKYGGWLGRATRFADLDDQVAGNRVTVSARRLDPVTNARRDGANSLRQMPVDGPFYMPDPELFGHPDAYPLFTAFASGLEEAGLAGRFPMDVELRQIAIELLAERSTVEEVEADQSMIEHAISEAQGILDERRR